MARIGQIGILVLLCASSLCSPASAQFFVNPENGHWMINGDLIHPSGEVNFAQLLWGDLGTLELVKDQRAALEKEMKAIGIANFAANSQRLSGDMSEDEFKKAMERSHRESGDLVQTDLLPFQITELKKIALMETVSRMSLSRAFSYDPVCKLLGLTTDEKKRMEKKAKELAPELERKILELKREALREILGELPEAKRASLGFVDFEKD